MMRRLMRITTIAVLLVLAGIVLSAAHRTVHASSDVAVHTVAVVGGTEQSARHPPAPIRFVKNPKPVPEFTVRDLDGHVISSATWRGKVTIVNFWATWCAPCLVEIPEFVALQKNYRDHLQIIGLSLDEGPADEVTRFVQEHGIPYRIAIADPDLAAKFGDMLGLPTSFVLDRQARVVQKHMGLISPAIYEQEVRALAGLP